MAAKGERFLPLPLKSLGRPGWTSDTGTNLMTTSVWQALASPGDRVALPSLSSIHADSKKASSTAQGLAFDAGRSLWNVVLQVSLTSLGWPSPAVGFLRWREAGYPTDDPRLELLKQLLGNDLDLHTGHLLQYLFGPDSWGRNLTDHESASRQRKLDDVRPAWLNRYDGQQPNSFLSPFTGGTDPLHLQVHVPFVGLRHVPMEPHGATPQVETYTGTGHAVMIVDEYATWYGKLANFGAGLTPRADGRSWRVDVIVKQVGWLGTYRRSRLTGRWFGGPHSMHEWGVLSG